MDKDTENKFRALGLHFGAKHLSPPERKEKQGYSALKGSTGENSLGSYYFIDSIFDENYIHGLIEFSHFFSDTKIKFFPGMDISFNIKECCFIDTETTGLSQSAGTFAFMVGVGIIQDDHLLIRQYFLRSPSEEAAMLLDLDNFLTDSKLFVSYNGISFDIPILRNRYILYRMPHHFKQKGHLDLLKYSRSIWRYQFEDRSLKSIEGKVLGYQRSSDEIPGWMAPEIYRNFLKTGNTSQIDGVLYHNAMDVVSLAALLSKVDKMLSSSSDYINQYDTVNFSIARLFESKKDLEKAIRIYEQAINQDNIPEIYKVKALQALARIKKKFRNFPEAVQIWIKAVELKDIDSMIELAKYYEHNEKNISQAIYYINLAINTLILNDQRFKLQSYKMEFDHRLERLKKKLEKL
jgi:hypothetical protein